MSSFPFQPGLKKKKEYLKKKEKKNFYKQTLETF